MAGKSAIFNVIFDDNIFTSVLFVNGSTKIHITWTYNSSLCRIMNEVSWWNYLCIHVCLDTWLAIICHLRALVIYNSVCLIINFFEWIEGRHKWMRLQHAVTCSWDTFSTSTVLFRTTTWCYRKLHLINMQWLSLFRQKERYRGKFSNKSPTIVWSLYKKRCFKPPILLKRYFIWPTCIVIRDNLNKNSNHFIWNGSF